MTTTNDNPPECPECGCECALCRDLGCENCDCCDQGDENEEKMDYKQSYRTGKWESSVNEKYSSNLRPCPECPFRKASAPGWLGPWEPSKLLASLPYEIFPCHRTIGDNTDSLRGCAGAAIYLNNRLEISRCHETAEHQQVLKDSDDADSVFSGAGEFLDHHQRIYEKWHGGKAL